MIDCFDDRVGECVGIVRSYEPAGGPVAVTIDHRWESATAGGDDGPCDGHGFERELGVRVVDGRHDDGVADREGVG
jgi:hypothetical protein